MEQLSGLLAVHGWSVPWKGTSRLGGHSPQHPIGLWYPTELLLPLFSHSVVSDSFATPWTRAYQAPLSMGFSRQEYRSGLPFPSPGDLPIPGIKSTSPALEADFFTAEPPGKPPTMLPTFYLFSVSCSQLYFSNCDFENFQRIYYPVEKPKLPNCGIKFPPWFCWCPYILPYLLILSHSQAPLSYTEPLVVF